MSPQKNGSGKFGKYIYLVELGGLKLNSTYDMYSSFVGCADSEYEVRRFHPDGCLDENDVGSNWKIYKETGYIHSPWVKLSEVDNLEVTLLGNAVDTVKNVFSASYHAG